MIKEIYVKDLKPHPLNAEYYDNENCDNEKLRKSLRNCYDKKGIPNREAVQVDKNNVIYSGHRRWESCKEEDIPILKCEIIEHTFDPDCLTDIKKKKTEKQILEDYNEPGVKRNEYAWNVIIKKYGSDNLDNEFETGKLFNGEQRNKWCAKRTDKTPKEFKDMVDVVYKYDRYDLVEKVESGEYSVRDALNEASQKEPEEKLKTNPDEIDLIKHFNENKEQVEGLKKYGIDFFNNIKKLTMGDTPVILDEHIGWEDFTISGILSHTFMSATCKSFMDNGFFAISPRSEPGLTDVRILKQGNKVLTKKGYHPLRAEIKCAELKGDGYKTKIYGGGGSHRMEPHTFIIAIHDNDGERLMLLATKMTKEDWIRKGKGNSAKYEMPMSYWAENHFDNKDDWVCLHGGIYKDKRGVLKIQCMPV